MKKLLTFPILLILTSVFLVFWWQETSGAPSSDEASYPFVINKGATATQIAANLEREGFIKSALAFKIYVQIKGQAGKIQAGDYRLEKNLTLPALVNDLVRGPIAVWVILQEGLRREEMALKIASSLGLPNDKKQEFITEFLNLTEGSEGHLFPNTYLFMRNTTLEVIVNKLTDTFDAKITPEIKSGVNKQDLTLGEAVTLASIVERETRTDEERPIVAGILLKRLRVGMALQADATLQYAVSDVRCQVSDVGCDWWEPVKAEDKNIKSPYNTYARPGLPPTPIASPGLSSIKAVANPQDSQYWYYLHDNDGKIHYAETLEEHGENIRKYLQ